MKIAIVGPSPVPFTVGGCENLLWGLTKSINEETEHVAELIKLPSKEHSFWELIETYYSFYQLDLSQFDLLISTKYPSWMVRHPNSICYMVHTLRGLYDTYHWEYSVTPGCEAVDCVLAYMEQNERPENLDKFFALLWKLRETKDIPKEYYAFPGPLIRKLVHYMDQWGLSQEGVKGYAAISNTVRDRVEYYPEGAVVHTVYPPSTLTHYHAGEYQYVFMISRLDAPKRIHMLIQAMRYVKAPVKLLIAGTGPEAQTLKNLAKDDDRIEFLGFVKDEEVEDYYANCLVVPYFPYDEDLGLITIEAMMHEKPVITTNDAGGPNEFVTNGKTGFVTRFHAKEIAEKIDYFATHPEEAKRMGRNGFELVSEITWKRAATKLVALATSGEASRTVAKSRRKKLVIASTFRIYPPVGGGQARSYALYKELAKRYDVEIVSLGIKDTGNYSKEIAKNMWETSIARTSEQREAEWEIEQQVHMPVSDIAAIHNIEKTTEYCKELERAIRESDIVVMSHPYLYQYAKQFITKQQLIYDAQDAEYLIKKAMLPDVPIKEELLEQVFAVEQCLLKDCHLAITCSKEDQEQLAALYHTNPEKMYVVANGVDTKAIKYEDVRSRLYQQRKRGLDTEQIAIFMGSKHGPNLEGCEAVLSLAKKCPDTKFYFMGTQCEVYQKRKLPVNLGLLGLVSDEEKQRIFSLADLALNPMFSGSGTNLKMFDYMAAGLPVLTTKFGSRGIRKKESFFVAEIEEWADIINQFSLEETEEMVEQARNYVEDEFDWKVIADQLMEKLEEK